MQRKVILSPKSSLRDTLKKIIDILIHFEESKEALTASPNLEYAIDYLQEAVKSLENAKDI